MNKKELEELIDSEVEKILANMNMKEPQPQKSEIEQSTPVYSAPARPTLSEEELDEILFYGGSKPKNENK